MLLCPAGIAFQFGYAYAAGFANNEWLEEGQPVVLQIYPVGKKSGATKGNQRAVAIGFSRAGNIDFGYGYAPPAFLYGGFAAEGAKVRLAIAYRQHRVFAYQRYG